MTRGKAFLTAVGVGGAVYALSRGEPGRRARKWVRRRRRRMPDAGQLLASLAGGALMVYGMRRQRALGRAAQIVGTKLLRRGVTA